VSHDQIDAFTLATYKEEKVSGSKKPQWILTMRPEVAKALKNVGIV